MPTKSELEAEIKLLKEMLEAETAQHISRNSVQAGAAPLTEYSTLGLCSQFVFFHQYGGSGSGCQKSERMSIELLEFLIYTGRAGNPSQ